MIERKDIDKEEKGMNVFKGGKKIDFGKLGGNDDEKGKVRKGEIGI